MWRQLTWRMDSSCHRPRSRFGKTRQRMSRRSWTKKSRRRQNARRRRWWWKVSMPKARSRSPKIWTTKMCPTTSTRRVLSRTTESNISSTNWKKSNNSYHSLNSIAAAQSRSSGLTQFHSAITFQPDTKKRPEIICPSTKWPALNSSSISHRWCCLACVVSNAIVNRLKSHKIRGIHCPT